MSSGVVTLLNSTTLLVPVERSHNIRYILGAVYVRGGYSVPCSKFRDVRKYYPLQQNILTYCEQMENAYMIAEEYKSGSAVLPTHPFLMEHQRVAWVIARHCPRYAFFMDTGTGKTATMLAVINDSRDIKWVVMCPKSIMRTAWRDDSAKFYPDIRVFIWDADITRSELVELSDKWNIEMPYRIPKKTLFDILWRQADIIVINPEQFTAHHAKLPHEGFIIDESTTVKNPTSKLSKEVDKYAVDCDRVYELSGEPAPNGMEDYFHQIKLIDTSILGNGFTSFKQRYFIPCGYMGYEIKLKEGAAEQLADKVGSVSYMVKKEDCLDLPEKVYERKTFRLAPSVQKTYKMMADDFIAMADTMDDLVMVFNKAGSLMKLRQITSGFIIDAENKVVNELHSQRINLLKETLSEIGKRQVIIWAQFRHEIESIKAMLGDSACTAYGGTKNLQDSIDGFKDGRYQYIIAHPATLKFGVTFTNCNYAVYYSYDYNFESYYQSHDRIYRIGQNNKCTFITLECENTIDGLMLRAVREKQGLADFMAGVLSHCRMGDTNGDKEDRQVELEF